MFVVLVPFIYDITNITDQIQNKVGRLEVIMIQIWTSELDDYICFLLYLVLISIYPKNILYYLFFK